MPGKLDPETLAAVLGRTGAEDDALAVGPAYGEDAAAIDLGDETLVVSSDPISLAASRVGTLAVHVAANDVAASGADPRWLTSVLVLPDDSTLEAITEDVDAAATGIGATVVGGHTEFDASRDRPFACLTALGTTERFVPTGGAAPGARLLLTDGTAIEGTAILAADFRADLEVPAETVEAGLAFFDRVSVVDAARALREHASAMHDPTEGGVLAGCVELAAAAGVAVSLEREAIPVATPTRALCAAVGVDPLRIFGSGALLAAVAPDRVEEAVSDCEAAGIEVAEIGAVEAGSGVTLDGDPIAEPVDDDMYGLWEG